MRPPRPGSLRVIADALFVDVACQSCKHGFSVTVGNARSKSSVHCPHCRIPIDLTADPVKQRVSAIESTLWRTHHAQQSAKRRQSRKLAAAAMGSSEPG